jgi:hypothetical protein
VKTTQNLVVFSALATIYVGLAPGQRSPEAVDVSDVRIVSSFVAPGDPVPGECREEAHAFAMTLVRYPRPASWHWVLICDEAGWRRFLRLSGRGDREGIYASTDLAERTTYLRGVKLLYPYDLYAEPDDIIAHELAHIWLDSSNESSADSLARRWRGASREEGR